MKKIKSSLLILALISSQFILASDLSKPLQSRPFLGVSGSIEQPNSTNEYNGALIDRVIPGGTGDALTLKPNDLITSINTIKLRSFQHLIDTLKNINVNDTLLLEVTRDDEKIQLTGKLKARPKETVKSSSSYEIFYDSVNINNNRLRSIVYRPKLASTNKPFPALYFVQGYTCDSIDYGLIPELTSHQILNTIAEAGYVVYKIEKFGIGDSIGDTQCSQIDFSSELAGFNAGLDALKSYDFVDKNQVHLFGHSLGGVYAPLIAQNSPLKSLISYGSVVKPWYDYLLDIYAKQALIFGTSSQQAKANSEVVKPLLNDWLKSNKKWSEVVASPENKAALASNLIPIREDQVFQRHYTFFRDLNRYDFAQAWKQTSSHVLAIHGSLDIQAIDDKWATQMTTLPQKKGLITKKIVLNGTEHGFMKYDSMDEYLEARNNRSYNPSQPGTHYDSRVSKTIIDWLNSFKEDH